MIFTSVAFKKGKDLPDQYTRVGEDISPPLEWSNAPEGTKSFALICDDPDTPRGTWVHWILYNLSAEQKNLEENSSISLEHLGINSWQQQAYGDPCPPHGRYLYYFKIYALNKTLAFEKPPTKKSGKQP